MNRQRLTSGTLLSDAGEWAIRERHAAVAALCSEVAHEVAPALALLRDIVLSGTLDPVRHGVAEEELARLQGVVAALRRTRPPEDTRAPIHLAEVAERAAERVRNERETLARVAVDVPSEVRVVASEWRLEMMLVTLLRNAVEASQGREVRVTFQRGEDECIVTIEDPGAGLESGLIDRIFQPLSTLGSGGKGTGIVVVTRAIRDEGWSLNVRRDEAATVWGLHICNEDVMTASVET